ncbi:putative disease resistance protein At1g58400 [Chenopodium quinoa]|uniref:putative disease resistance protein At1g58400 n=1 Tax=Chenopodium quinoa TaxID=63459 RepID=UPI000B78E642|nr:putative disease resistance protein At1g58400 [Chenopodium quinoa]
MAVEAVVSVVIQKVTDLLIQESKIFDKVVDQVEDIRLELRQMRGFLTDAEELPKDEKDAKKWVGKYLNTLYKLEDMVESYVLKLVHKKMKDSTITACWKLRRKLKHIEDEIKALNKSRPHNIEDASLRKLSFHIEQKQQNLDNLSDKNLSTGSSSRTKRMLSGVCEEDDSDYIGFKDYENSLKSRLTEKDGVRIDVVGRLGSGKTTLVKRIYNCKSIKEQFVCHAWLDVSEEHKLKDLLLKVWNQVNKKRDNELTLLSDGELRDKLCEFLRGKKCLIILDDARKQPDACRELIEALSLQNMNEYKVVVLNIDESRDGNAKLIELQPLEENESWELFLRSLRNEEGICDISGNASLRDQIVKKCQGLPLNIVLLGGFLSTKKMNSAELTRVFSQANWKNTDVWLLSYADLPAHHKLCLLYLTLFPKEFDLSVRRILRLWLAEGFLQRSSGLGEDLAEKCFDDLVRRNLIKISKFRSDGGPKKCRLPGFQHEQLSPKAEEIRLFHIHQMSSEQTQPPSNKNNKNPMETSPAEPSKPPSDKNNKNPMETSPAEPSILRVRRIVAYADITDNDFDSDFQNLRSYFSFNCTRYDTPAKGVGNFLRRIIGSRGFGLLRVLDLEGVYKPILPTTLKYLFQLRYLGLRWTFLDNLPESVGDLPYLETLDLKRTYINNLPSSVWKLKHLRHLNLPQVRLDMRIQQPSKKLLTLWGIIIDDGCNMENGLGQLNDLRELGITCCQLTRYEDLLKWITSQTHLQSLSLTSKDESGCPSRLELENLSQLHKITHLKLLGKLNRLLNNSEFPPYIRVLTLSVSNLNDDPMRVLSQLKYLSVLRLLAESYCGQKMQCPENGFVNLRVLKLWMLNNLEEWVVELGGMPNIKELEIRSCQQLKELPNKFLERTTLKELILTNMPKDFVEKVGNSKFEHTILQTNHYEFTPLPWEKKP